MDAKTLEKFGLTEGESKVYLALLKLGPSTVGSVMKQSGVSHSKVYDVIERLCQKGIASKVSINNRQHFEAKQPLRLREFLEKKKQELQEQQNELEAIMPLLNEIQKNSEPIHDVEILLGKNGIKTALDLALNELTNKDTIYILGVPKRADTTMDGYFRDWYDRRAKKKILCKVLYNPEMRKLAEERRKIPLMEQKILPSGSMSPSGVNIMKDKLIIHIFGERPFSVVIKNKEAAKSFLNYFNLLWAISKKL